MRYGNDNVTREGLNAVSFDFHYANITIATIVTFLCTFLSPAASEVCREKNIS